MENKIYIKKFIKTEEDLPKENGEYFIKIKTPSFIQELTAVGYIWADIPDKVNAFWLNKVDWYLMPVEIPSEEEIEKESNKMIINFLTHNNPEGDFKESTIGADDKRQWWAGGANWLLNKLLGK